MITPMDIHNKTFSGQLRGYSKDEVNAFLEELASDYEKIYREHRAMEEEMDIIRTKLRNYEKMESTMSHTLVMAQETADNVKKNAHKEAELSIQEAQSEAQKIVSDAEAARRKMNADLLKAEGDIEAAKAARAPQAVQAQQPAVSDPSEPTAEAEPSSPEEAAAPAAEAPEAAPAPAGGNLFDEAAKTVAPKEEN